jgi:hypothetical protein
LLFGGAAGVTSDDAMSPTNSLQPVTLGDLIGAGKLLWVYCCDCCRDVDPASVPLPASFPVPSLGSRMKSSGCASRKINTKPELYPGGIETMRQRPRELGGS